MERSSTGGLRRQLGLADATLLVIGAIIGTGIFSTPGFVAAMLQDGRLVLLAWVLGGVISLAGALSYAELGAAWPRAGGHYIYMRLAYGPFWGFLDGWMAFLVTFPGSIAAMSLAFAAYLGQLFPALEADRLLLSGPWIRLHTGQVTAVGAIMFLSAINYLGVRAGAWMQDALTALKMLLLVAFVLFGMLWWPSGREPLALPHASPRWSMLGAALIPVMFTYFGWDAATYVAGELCRPARTLPLAALWGTLTVMALYVAINLVFLRAVPPARMSGSIVVADMAARAIFGAAASIGVTIAVIFAILGGLNATILTGPRILYAMARDRLFFRRAERIHPRWGTPSGAIWIQAGWSAILAVSGTFEALFTAVGFVITLLAGATAVGVLVVRHRHPAHPRPYRAGNTPFIPLIFAAACVWIATSSIIERPLPSLAGCAMLVSAWPAYLIWKSRTR